MKIDDERAHRRAIEEYHQIKNDLAPGMVSERMRELLGTIIEYEMRFVAAHYNMGWPDR